MKKMGLIALGIALVILVSGCTEQRAITVSSNDGLIIKEFSTDAPRYSNEEIIPLYFEVENVGGTTATNVVMDIIGASWTTIAQNSVGIMSPPDLTIQPPTPGDFDIYSVSVPAYSTLPEGVEADVTLWGKVTYDYSSNGMVTLTLINKDEYRRRMQMNADIPSGVTVFSSEGPVHIDIDERGVDPIISEESVEGSTQEVPLRIYINNVGGGAPITGGEVGAMTATFSLEGLGASFTECNGVAQSGSSVTLDLILRRGASVIIPCKAVVTTPALTGVFSVLFETDYTYFVEEPLTVTVVGAPE